MEGILQQDTGRLNVDFNISSPRCQQPWSASRDYRLHCSRERPIRVKNTKERMKLTTLPSSFAFLNSGLSHLPGVCLSSAKQNKRPLSQARLASNEGMPINASSPQIDAETISLIPFRFLFLPAHKILNTRLEDGCDEYPPSSARLGAVSATHSNRALAGIEGCHRGI